MLAWLSMIVTGQREPGEHQSWTGDARDVRSEEHTSELQSHLNLVCRLLLEKKKKTSHIPAYTETACSSLPPQPHPTKAPRRSATPRSAWCPTSTKQPSRTLDPSSSIA